MDGIAILIGGKPVKDSLGQFIDGTETRTEVFVSESSVTRSEFFEAGRSGLNASIVLTTSIYNYNDEEICEYNGRRYAIYRTFARDDEQIELYLKKEGGKY